MRWLQALAASAPPTAEPRAGGEAERGTSGSAEQSSREGRQRTPIAVGNPKPFIALSGVLEPRFLDALQSLSQEIP